MRQADLEMMRARDAALIEMRGGGAIVAAFHDRRALLAYVDALIAAARKVTCLRCGGDGFLTDFNRATKLYDDTPCPSCDDLRALLREKP